jgi:hypothetical protein
MSIRSHNPFFSLRSFRSLAALFLACGILSQASAVTVTLYQGGDDFFGSSPAGFTYDDFNGQTTDTGTSLIVDLATEVAPGNGLFGGLGRDIPGGQVDFDANTHQLRLEYRLLADNMASNFRVVLSDIDDADSAEDFQYFVDPSFASPLGDGFSEQFLMIDAASSVFRQTSFGFVDAGDSVLNFGLRQWQVQSEFGSANRLAMELRLIEIVPIPEPGTGTLFGSALLALLFCRRR